MCRHPALYGQIGADLEVVKWVRNGYELKLKVCHECLLPTWFKSCGTFLRLAVEKLDLN